MDFEDPDLFPELVSPEVPLKIFGVRFPWER